MSIVFNDKYVSYNQIDTVSLIQINDVLLENDIFLELGDDFSNDWAGYSYFKCKSLNDFDEETINSFIYIITWFMTSNPVDISLKSSEYYKNDKIISECLKIYNNLESKYDSEVDLCKELFKEIYTFYLDNHDNYIKKTIGISCLLNYKEMNLFKEVEGDSYGDKMSVLLDYYFNHS